MTVDRAMLDRVVADVFDEDFAVEDATAAGDALRPAVLVSSRLVQGRTAIIRASHTWLDGFIPELNVQTGIRCVKKGFTLWTSQVVPLATRGPYG